jgi:ribose transport system ATP-binding protein
VHALIGENGAGKTTVVKILSGLTQPDAGSISIMGEVARFRNPRDSYYSGIQTVYQEISLIPYLTVMQNMLLPYEPTNSIGMVNKRKEEQIVRAQLESLDIENIDLYAEVQTLDISVQQKLEIAKAISRNPRFLLLDEPSSALSRNDVEWLAGQIRRLRSNGVTIIYITHIFKEVHMFCDSLTVLRNGKNVGSFREKEVTDQEVIRLVIGRSLDVVFPRKEPFARNSQETPVLLGKDLATQGGLKGVSFQLWPGEVLGLAALQGMGQAELFHVLFGDANLAGGHIERNGQKIRLSSPADAIQVGIGLIPHDRKNEGLFLQRSGKHNVTLPALKKFVSFGFIRSRYEEIIVDQMLARINIHPSAIYKHASSLSGGNQQKVIIAKWLSTGSQILLMLDPTRGIDVGTKYEVYKIIRDFIREEGRAVFIYSSEVPELIGLCDRVLVMYQGMLNGEFHESAMTEEKIMSAMLGVKQADMAK